MDAFSLSLTAIILFPERLAELGLRLGSGILRDCTCLVLLGVCYTARRLCLGRFAELGLQARAGMFCEDAFVVYCEKALHWAFAELGEDGCFLVR